MRRLECMVPADLLDEIDKRAGLLPELTRSHVVRELLRAAI